MNTSIKTSFWVRRNWNLFRFQHGLFQKNFVPKVSWYIRQKTSLRLQWVNFIFQVADLPTRHGKTWRSQASALAKHTRRVWIGYRVLPPLLKVKFKWR